MVTFYDAPVSDVLKPLLKNQEAFAFSLIIYPMSDEIDGISISAKIENKGLIPWPTLESSNAYIASLYADNPSAKVLCLAELIGQHLGSESVISMPLSNGSSISFKII
jgi:hypothetical protein